MGGSVQAQKAIHCLAAGKKKCEAIGPSSDIDPVSKDHLCRLFGAACRKNCHKGNAQAKKGREEKYFLGGRDPSGEHHNQDTGKDCDEDIDQPHLPGLPDKRRMVQGGDDKRRLRTEDGGASSGEKPAYSLCVNDLYLGNRRAMSLLT